jgi:hypothetical protein
MDVHLGVRKIRNAAGMIAIKVRQQQMPHLASGIAERLDLPRGGLGRIEPRRRLPHPFRSEPRRVGDIVEADAGIGQRQPVIGLDQQTMAHHAGALENAAGAVHQAPADRTHGAGVEMMDAHDEVSFEVRRPACHSQNHR